MKIHLKIIVALLTVIATGAQTVHPNEQWQSCELEDCEQQGSKKYKMKPRFSIKNLNKGLKYFTDYNAPLSLLVPEKIAYTGQGSDYIDGVDLPKTQYLQNLVRAQVQLVQWFRDDLDLGLKVPRITWDRLVRINQFITGDYHNFQVKSHPFYDFPMSSQLEMRYLTEGILDEIIKTTRKLRAAAGITDHDSDWGVAVRFHLKQGESAGKDDAFARLHPDDVLGMLYQREQFLSNYLRVSGEHNQEIKREAGGGYYIAPGSDLYFIDAARNYYEAKDGLNSMNLKYSVYEKRISGTDPLFYLVDVPDKYGKTSVDYPNPCYDCERVWPTLLPSTDFRVVLDFSALYLTASLNFNERKLMFDKALSSLKNRLKARMPLKDIVDVFAKSWQELVLAHAFPDGNGRTIRLLINSLLMAYGLPPLTCSPNCQPYSHKLNDLKEFMEQAMEKTKQPLANSDYPEWLTKPQDPELLEQLKAM